MPMAGVNTSLDSWILVDRGVDTFIGEFENEG
jgi:hypothetical protein